MAFRPEPEPRARFSWKVVLTLWTIYGLTTSLQELVGAMAYGRHEPWWFGPAQMMPQAYLWALLTPFILWWGNRFPPRGPGWPGRVLIHVATSITIVTCMDSAFELYLPYLSAWAHVPLSDLSLPLGSRIIRVLAWWLVFDTMLYWVVLFIGSMRDAGARAQAKAMRESQLETQLAQAELHSLKMQLHPHFLFNALHTVGTLVRTGKSALAVQVVGRLGDLLRRMLDGAATQEVPLREELEFARNYLDVEQARFSDRLKVTWTVEPGAQDAAVPHLILQPLLENAIRHGISAATASGILIVGARCTNGTLHLTVRDDGPGMADDPSRSVGSSGVGLANTRLRLARLYGDRAGLEVLNAEDGGVTSHVFLPFRPAAPGR